MQKNNKRRIRVCGVDYFYSRSSYPYPFRYLFDVLYHLKFCKLSDLHMHCRFQCPICVKQFDPFYLFFLNYLLLFYILYTKCCLYCTRTQASVESIIPPWFKTTIYPHKVSYKIQSNSNCLTCL
jgi:hypothetical protein